MSTNAKALVIGASAGGIKVLRYLLPRLPQPLPVPVLIAQHLPMGYGNRLVTALAGLVPFHITSAINQQPAIPGHIFIAPPDYHMLVAQDGSLNLSVSPPEHYARPSIDVLFESAAIAWQEALIGVLLTGANHDGAQGLRRIKALGGTTIVQKPEDAEHNIMPLSAIQLTRPDAILALNEIPEKLARLIVPL